MNDQQTIEILRNLAHQLIDHADESDAATMLGQVRQVLGLIEAEYSESPAPVAEKGAA